MARRKKRQIFKKKKFHSGITLPELLVTVFLFLFISGALYASFSVGQDSWEINNAKITLQRELRRATEAMKYDLIQAGNESIMNVTADGQEYSSITFKVPLGATGGSIIWEDEHIIFSLNNGGQLLRTKGSSSRIIGQNIDSISFRRKETSPDILEVVLTGKNHEIRGDPMVYELNFQVKLRN